MQSRWFPSLQTFAVFTRRPMADNSFVEEGLIAPSGSASCERLPSGREHDRRDPM